MEKTETDIQGVKKLGQYAELATEAAQVGLFCYLAGGVPSSLLGDCLSLQIKDADEALGLSMDAIKKTKDPELNSHIIRHFFFRFGIYQGFLKKSSGAFQKQQTAKQGGGRE